MTVSGFDGVDKHAAPEKSLVEVKKKNAGRNNYGRITVRHHGGGNRQKYRIIDFKRDKRDVAGAGPAAWSTTPTAAPTSRWSSIRTARRRYILAPVGLARRRHRSSAGESADIKPGNALPLANIPVGTVIHNIEMYPGKGAQLVRSAGNAAQLMAKEGDSRDRPYAVRRDAQDPHELLRPPSARSATSTTPTSLSAKPAVSVTWAGVRQSAARS